MNNNSFIGKKLKDVEQFYELDFRVVSEDGVSFGGTCDYKPFRYNFTVENGIITSVKMG